MSKSFFNWTFNQVTRFLNKNGFFYTHAKGSHHYYTGIRNHETKIVVVPFHGSKPIKPRTFKSIVLQSGIPIDKWMV
jgi:predicted RNA binding protein YcfA (HicA-like mRNA interferase family)